MLLRVTLCALATLALSVGGLRADDQKSKTDKKGKEATITKVDPQNHTITVRMKDKSGKETKRTFKLAEDVRYFDSTGRAAAIDVFRSGDLVLVVEEEGRLKEIHKHDKSKSPPPGDNKKPGGGK